MNVFPGWVPAHRTGTQARVGVSQGYQPPAVLQPTGNYDAWDVVYEAPSNPFFDQPIQCHLRTPEQLCRPARCPDGLLPDGTEIFEKTLPGAPILKGPNGGIVVPHPSMPTAGRGPAMAGGEIIPAQDAEMNVEDAADHFGRGAMGTLGAVAVIALLAYFGLKARA